MILYASVIPYDDLERNVYSTNQELTKSALDMVEIVFLYICLRDKTNYTDQETTSRILNVALTWTLAESLFSYFFYFIYNATGEEFKWEFIKTAIVANIDLYERIALVALTEMLDCLTRLRKFNLHIIALIVCKFVFNTFHKQYLTVVNLSPEWDQILLRSAFCGVFCFFTK